MSQQSIDEVWKLRLHGENGELGEILGTEDEFRGFIAEWMSKRFSDELVVLHGFTDTADRATHEVTITASLIKAASLVRMY